MFDSQRSIMRSVMTGLFLLGGTTLLFGCQDSQPSIAGDDLEQRLSQLESNALSNMVFIQGGTFIMGDFGAVGHDGVWRPYFPPTAERNKAHDVTLSSYSLSLNKTTWDDFDTYLLANNMPVIERNYSNSWERQPFQQDSSSRFYSEKPARVTWQEAKDYCHWLGQRTGLPMDLPTSAQWEFAGRNRGSNEWIFSTHDGKPLSVHHELAELVKEGGEYVPVGSRLPPNPLGIYDMADNGKEWVNDWLSDTWYRDNPQVTDPKGPEYGDEKILRNLDFSFSRIGVTETIPTLLGDRVRVSEFTFRCALHSPTPVATNSP